METVHGFFSYVINIKSNSSLLYPQPPAGSCTMIPDYWIFIISSLLQQGCAVLCLAAPEQLQLHPSKKIFPSPKLTFTPGPTGTRKRVHLQKLDLVTLQPVGQNPEQVSFPASSTKLQLHENQFCCLKNIRLTNLRTGVRPVSGYICILNRVTQTHKTAVDLNYRSRKHTCFLIWYSARKVHPRISSVDSLNHCNLSTVSGFYVVNNDNVGSGYSYSEFSINVQH
jgi:hypothetical protein